MESKMTALTLAVLACGGGDTLADPLGTAFTYQGRLESDGVPVNGLYDLTFALFSGSGGAGQLGLTQTNLATDVSEGLFTVLLDFGTNFPGADRWLETRVRTNGSGAFTTLWPRQQLTPAPYALYASIAGTITGPLVLGSNMNAVPQAGMLRWTGTDFEGYTGSRWVSVMTNVNSALLGGLSSSSFWQLGGNGGTRAENFLGTTDNQPLEMRVNGGRALRLEPTANSPNVIGGDPNNSVAPGVSGASIGGGGTNAAVGSFTTVGGGAGNTSAADYATVGGGHYNTSSGDTATVAGGASNRSVGVYATVGGGRANTSRGFAATVGGGQVNLSDGDNAAVGGGWGNQSLTNFATIGGGFENTSGGVGAVVAGGSGNTSAADYATVAGGRYNRSGGDTATVGGGVSNRSLGVYATVGGGKDNTSRGFAAMVGGGQVNLSEGDHAAVGGGWGNQCMTNFATIGGGFENTSSGVAAVVAGGSGNTSATNYATVPGGYHNVAGGSYSFASGRNAKAMHDGAFVWADSQTPDFDPGTMNGDAIGGINSFNVRATGGIYFVTGIDGTGHQTGGLYCPPGGGAFISYSDRQAKENFQDVNPLEILDKVVALPMQSWNYKSQEASIRHVGATAQDFKAAFGVGETDKGINTVDADGVALAAIQGLNQKVEKRSAKLEAENAALKEEVAELKRLVDQLNARFDHGEP